MPTTMYANPGKTGKSGGCGCGCGGTCGCDTFEHMGVLERPRYFGGQVITPAELNLQHSYLHDKIRRLTFFLHGWGVVCGATVAPVIAPPDPGQTSSGTLQPWLIQVLPGYVLGPYGDEIVIDCPRVVDLRTQGTTGACGDSTSSAGAPAQAMDPWCSNPSLNTDGATVYIAIRYRQEKSRPVRVQPMGCDCEGSQCEYSRWRDGFEIGVLTVCPDQAPPGDAKTPAPALPPWYNLQACPCPPGPWVSLAQVTIDAHGAVTIDNCACRRTVTSFASVLVPCPYGPITGLTITDDKGQPLVLTQGQTNVAVNVKGSGLNSGAKFFLGEGITVNQQTYVAAKGATPSSFVLDVSVAATAGTGLRDFSVVNPDGTNQTQTFRVK